MSFLLPKIKRGGRFLGGIFGSFADFGFERRSMAKEPRAIIITTLVQRRIFLNLLTGTHE